MLNSRYSFVASSATDLTVSFQSIYADTFGEMYHYTFRVTIPVLTKIKVSYLKELIVPSLPNGAITDETISVIRGVSLWDYESIEEYVDENSDESSGKTISLNEDYLDYYVGLCESTKIGIFIQFGKNIGNQIQLSVVGADEDLTHKVFEQLTSALEVLRKSDIRKSVVNFICSSNDGMYLHEFSLTTGKTVDIDNHYNDDFKKVSNHIIESLSDNRKDGIVLLHGIPGTGKTTFIRHLIHNLKRKVIYISPDMSAKISDPSFLTFLMENKNSVLIIEDAENVIKSREAGENQAVSNLLNITNGIIGDGLKIQVVCTFNTRFEDIDPALRRPGRLIAEYKFDALSEDKTLALVHNLYGEDAIPKSKSMTLAEIFNMNSESYKAAETKHSFGFIG